MSDSSLALGHPSQDPSHDQRKRRVAMLSVASNSLLLVGKLAVGLAIGSVSVLSEAIHSGVDLVAALIAWVAVGMSGKPADFDHPFGHGKIENLSGSLEALLIFVAAGWILVEATRKLLNGSPLDAPAAGLWIMLVSALLNFGVSRLLFKVGRETHSVALQADAWHLATDVWTSLGVMTALGLIQVGHWLQGWLGLPWLGELDWLDPLVAIAVAFLILKAAWKLTLDAGRDLLDASWPKEEQDWVRIAASRAHPQVSGIHGLRTRRGGATRFAEFHLVVDKDLSLDQAHGITDTLAATIGRQYPGVQVTIHVEPANGLRRVDPLPEGSSGT